MEDLKNGPLSEAHPCLLKIISEFVTWYKINNVSFAVVKNSIPVVQFMLLV